MAIGLTYRPVNPRLARAVMSDGEGDDSSDEEGLPPREPPSQGRPEVRKHRIFRGVGACYEEAGDRLVEYGMTYHQQLLLHKAEGRERVAQFLLDAEKVIKHFFSAYFFHNGLIRYVRDSYVS